MASVLFWIMLVSMAFSFLFCFFRDWLRKKRLCCFPPINEDDDNGIVPVSVECHSLRQEEITENGQENIEIVYGSSRVIPRGSKDTFIYKKISQNDESDDLDQPGCSGYQPHDLIHNLESDVEKKVPLHPDCEDCAELRGEFLRECDCFDSRRSMKGKIGGQVLGCASFFRSNEKKDGNKGKNIPVDEDNDTEHKKTCQASFKPSSIGKLGFNKNQTGERCGNSQLIETSAPIAASVPIEVSVPIKASDPAEASVPIKASTPIEANVPIKASTPNEASDPVKAAVPIKASSPIEASVPNGDSDLAEASDNIKESDLLEVAAESNGKNNKNGGAKSKIQSEKPSQCSGDDSENKDNVGKKRSKSLRVLKESMEVRHFKAMTQRSRMPSIQKVDDEEEMDAVVGSKAKGSDTEQNLGARPKEVHPTGARPKEFRPSGARPKDKHPSGSAARKSYDYGMIAISQNPEGGNRMKSRKARPLPRNTKHSNAEIVKKIIKDVKTWFKEKCSKNENQVERHQLHTLRNGRYVSKEGKLRKFKKGDLKSLEGTVTWSPLSRKDSKRYDVGDFLEYLKDLGVDPDLSTIDEESVRELSEIGSEIASNIDECDSLNASEIFQKDFDDASNIYDGDVDQSSHSEASSASGNEFDSITIVNTEDLARDDIFEPREDSD